MGEEGRRRRAGAEGKDGSECVGGDLWRTGKLPVTAPVTRTWQTIGPSGKIQTEGEELPSTQREGSPGVSPKPGSSGSKEEELWGKLRKQREGQQPTLLLPQGLPAVYKIFQCLVSPCPCHFLFKICPPHTIHPHTIHCLGCSPSRWLIPPGYLLPSTCWVIHLLSCPHTSIRLPTYLAVFSTLVQSPTEPSLSSTIRIPTYCPHIPPKRTLRAGKSFWNTVGVSEAGRHPGQCERVGALRG